MVSEPKARITVVRRHAYVLWRSPHRWFDIVVWPLFDVLLWGSLGAFVVLGAAMTLLAAGQFPAGSMGPKVEAVTRFAERAGGTGIITSLARIALAIEGHLGTRVVPG